jgi:Fur family ferric uptake transcriptional regulator
LLLKDVLKPDLTLKVALNPQIFEEVSKIFRSYLETRELRKTPERFAILEEIYSRTGHFDVESLHQAMQDRKYQVSRATLYNTLELLEDCFLVTRHQFGKNISQYEKSFPNRQHDHLICTDCNKVVEFCDPRIYTIQKMVEETQQFRVMHHSLTFYASCARENCENFIENSSVTSKNETENQSI